MGGIAGWPEARAHIRARYAVGRDEATWLGLEWRFPGEPVEIFQPVEVTELVGLGRPWVRVLAAVAPVDNIDVKEALRHNFAVVEGRLAIFEELLVFFQCVPLPAEAADLDRALELVSQEAAQLRGSFAPRLAGPPPFTNYEE